MIVKKFEIFINENLASIFNRTWTYIDAVSSSLIDIIMRENGVSEKDFTRVDVIMKNVKTLLTTNDEAKEIIGEFESENKRVEFCAEYIYHYIINKK
jgi:hypothetical protein